MRDEKGPDNKILAVPIGDPRFSRIHDLNDIDPHWLREADCRLVSFRDVRARRNAR